MAGLLEPGETSCRCQAGPQETAIQRLECPIPETGLIELIQIRNEHSCVVIDLQIGNKRIVKPLALERGYRRAESTALFANERLCLRVEFFGFGWREILTG